MFRLNTLPRHFRPKLIYDNRNGATILSALSSLDSLRASRWRQWSRKWHRKWFQTRLLRFGDGGVGGVVGAGGDEGESLLLTPTSPAEDAKKGAEDPMDQLPQHLVDAFKR